MPKLLSFLVRIGGTTGMNMSIENNVLRFLCQTISVRPVPCFIDFPLPPKVQSAGGGAKP